MIETEPVEQSDYVDEAPRQLTPDVLQRSLAWAKTACSDEIQKERAAIGRQFFPTGWLNASVKQLKEHGVQVSVPR